LERGVKKNYLNLPKNAILFAQDESRFVSESSRITSWSTKGVCATYSGYRYGTSLNCFGSINLQNSELISSFHDTGNALATIAHLQKVRNLYDVKIPLYFMIDNASWHKTKAVTAFCEENNITLLFLPPYSPEYNPIERVWSFLKSKVKQRYFSSADKFRKYASELLQNINEDSNQELRSLCCSLI